MRSFEILVESERSSSHSAPLPTAPPRSGRRTKTNEVLDLFIHGANVTARVAERHASCVLRDLAWALAELSSFARQKRIVRFYEDAWELCVERLGERAMLSVYRGGAEPTVLVYDREVVFEEMCESVIDALDAALERSHEEAASITEARTALLAARAIQVDVDGVFIPEPLVLSIDADRDAPISFAAELSMRPGLEPDDALEESVERADLHALLARGRMEAEIRGRAVDLGDTCPFLFAERLLDLARRGLDKWERGQAFFARVDAGGVMIGIRMATGDAPATALTISRERAISTFPELPFFDVVEASLSFGRALVRGIVRRDRSQAGNLRLSAFRRDLRQLGEQVREIRRQDSRINPAPESYRAFAQRAPRPKNETGLFASGRLRYQQRWRALVPGIDLRSTFLCGDRLVIGAANETYCLDRQTGELIWRKSTPRAASVVTPAGIARISNDGSIQLHDFSTGEVTLRTWIAPRVTGPCAGAVVSTPGLPRLLIVTEGDRHLVAIDLTSGEARWRYTWGGRAGVLRMKRVGKLLYVSSGDSALTAVDVQSGSVVWRSRDRLRFRGVPTADHDVLFAVAGGDGSAAVVHAIDPFSGKPIWDARLTTPLCTIEGPALLGANSVCVAVRDRRGLCLAGFDRVTGKRLFHTESPVAPVGTSWLAVDDLLVGNTPNGELVGIDAGTGTTRWKHALGGAAECDVPRRLEPVLRSGALFVPHVDVHIVRPSDGAHLGTVGPCEAIPDLLRVDERCDVYVAEESGHMVCFGSGPRLSLVR